jgi:hypothetical protein
MIFSCSVRFKNLNCIYISRRLGTCYVGPVAVSFETRVFDSSRYQVISNLSSIVVAYYLCPGTLQELIAPSSLIFLNDCWEEVGTKITLQSMISRITGIQLEVLSGGTSLSNFSIAQRMSWAAHRKTTRVEDLAYCLMGLFGVNMPMLYGEGDRAFIRLQEEIMRVSDDESIFAWKARSGIGSDGGLLAQSPFAFEGSRDVIRLRRNLAADNPFVLTNKGIKIQMPSKSLANFNDRIVVLNCMVSGMNGKFIGICLRRISPMDQRYIRNRSEIWIMVEKHDLTFEFLSLELYIKGFGSNLTRTETVFKFGHIPIAELGEYGFLLQEFYPKEKDQGDYERFGDFYTWPNIWLIESKEAIDGILKIGDSHGVPFLVILKTTDRGELLVNVEQSSESEPLEEVVSSYDTEHSSSSQRRTWRAGLDRDSWEQPNGTWVVSVAIKRKIINCRERVQAVVITGHAPF